MPILAVFDLGDNVVLDANANAFVRIWYDPQLYQRIANTLRSNHELIPLNSRCVCLLQLNELIYRARLLDDAFTAAERGELTYKSVFQIVSYLCNEVLYLNIRANKSSDCLWSCSHLPCPLGLPQQSIHYL